MGNKGKLEARVTVPTGGYSVAVTEVGGGAGGTATIPAGDYYVSSGDTLADDLLQEWADQINGLAGTSGTYTVSSTNMGENDSGKVVISATGITSFGISWTSTVLRDLLGWTGNISGSLSYTAPEHCEAIWIPNCEYENENGGSTFAGWDESDLRGQESAAGHTFVLTGQRKEVQFLRWRAISRSKIWIVNESTVNESMQSFWRKAILAESSWAKRAGGPIRWYPDADTDGTYTTYTIPAWKTYRPSKLRENWVGGPWTIEIDRLVKVPS